MPGFQEKQKEQANRYKYKKCIKIENRRYIRIIEQADRNIWNTEKILLWGYWWVVKTEKLA